MPDQHHGVQRQHRNRLLVTQHLRYLAWAGHGSAGVGLALAEDHQVFGGQECYVSKLRNDTGKHHYGVEGRLPNVSPHAGVCVRTGEKKQ
jgi:hypothetical protein